MTKRGSAALSTWVAPWARAHSATAARSDASIAVAAEARVAGLLGRGAGARLVEVGEHHLPRRSRAAGRSWRRPTRRRRCPPRGSSSRSPVLEPEPGRHRGQPRPPQRVQRDRAVRQLRERRAAARRTSAPAMRWPSHVLSATPEPLHPVAYQSPSMRPQCGRRSSVRATLPPQARSTRTPASCGCTSSIDAVEEVAAPRRATRRRAACGRRTPCGPRRRAASTRGGSGR